MQLKSWISDGLWRNNLANDSDRDALINSSSSSAGMFYEWPASDGVNTNLYTSINRTPDMAVYSRLIVNLTKNRVKYSAAKIVGLLQRSKNKCKLIFLHCNKESNFAIFQQHKIKTSTWRTVELINSNQATYIFSLVTFISHGKQTPLRGKLWRDWSSTNKKKCSTSHFSLGRWRCFCRRHVCRTCYAVDRELSYPLEAKVSRFLSQGILQMVGDSNGHWTLGLHLNLIKLLFFSETAQKKLWESVYLPMMQL